MEAATRYEVAPTPRLDAWSLLTFSQPFDLRLPTVALDEARERARQRDIGYGRQRRFSGLWLQVKGDRVRATTNRDSGGRFASPMSPQLRGAIDAPEQGGVRVAGRLRYFSEPFIVWLMLLVAALIAAMGIVYDNAAGWFALLPLVVAVPYVVIFVRRRAEEAEELAWRMAEALATVPLRSLTPENDRAPAARIRERKREGKDA